MYADYFPHATLRPGQDSFIEDVSQALDQGACILAQAPTGIGKTAGSLAPAIQYGITHGKTTIFLTSRQTQHRIAMDTLRSMAEQHPDLALRVVDVIGKQSMCINRDVKDTPAGSFHAMCTLAVGQKKCRYAREPNAVDLEQTKALMSSEEAVTVGRSIAVCPYILQNQLAKKANVIIADYNHIFSDAGESMLESWELSWENIILIVDEAHNLVERVRSNYSHELPHRRLTESIRELQNLGVPGRQAAIDALYEFNEHVKHRLKGARATGQLVEDPSPKGSVPVLPWQYEDLPAELRGRIVKGLQDVIESHYEATKEPLPTMDNLLQVFVDWSRFRHCNLVYASVEDGDWTFRVRLIDPAQAVADRWVNTHAAILMSGTLHPGAAHRDLLGMRIESTMLRTYSSPFPVENRPTTIHKDTTTAYKERTESTWTDMADKILSSIKERGGNAAVFAPSYNIMLRIEEALSPRIKQASIVEDPSMTKGERERVLGDMRGFKDRGQGCVLFGVLGGSFSEGVDFKDNLLDSVHIVGLPLAPPTLEVKSQIAYYDERFPGKGNLYAYTVPAMNKVLQAMGRGIRSETDVCHVHLLEKRLDWSQYRDLIPNSSELRTTGGAPKFESQVKFVPFRPPGRR